MSRCCLLPVISTMSYAGGQIPWLSIFLAPVLRRSVTRLTIWTSSPSICCSQEGFRKVTAILQQNETLLHLFTEEASLLSRGSNPKDEEAQIQDIDKDGVEQIVIQYPLHDFAPPLVDEFHFSHISNLVQRSEEVLQLAERKQTMIHASLIATREISY